MSDPVHQLAHDHADLNRRVLALGSLVARSGVGASELVEPLGELRELLFLHFAREEEGLFPFVAATVPELAERVDEMALAHDAICGALARMYHLAVSGAVIADLATVFGRFERSYVAHAHAEAALLQTLDEVLDPERRAQLGALVADL